MCHWKLSLIYIRLQWQYAVCCVLLCCVGRCKWKWWRWCEPCGAIEIDGESYNERSEEQCSWNGGRKTRSNDKIWRQHTVNATTHCDRFGERKLPELPIVSKRMLNRTGAISLCLLFRIEAIDFLFDRIDEKLHQNQHINSHHSHTYSRYFCVWYCMDKKNNRSKPNMPRGLT